MHPVRPVKYIDDSIRRSKRCEQMSEEVIIDMADSRNPKASGVQSSEPLILDEDPEEAADRTPRVSEEDMVEDVEAQARAPRTPSAADVKIHNAANYPCRSWCKHSVKDRGKDDCHRTVTGEFAESSITRVPMDYAFFTDDERQGDGAF